jgi:predicted exporter
MTGLNRYQSGFLAILALMMALAFVNVRLQTDITAFVIAGDSAEEVLLANEIQSGLLSRQILIAISAPEGKAVSQAFFKKVTDDFKVLPGVADIWPAGESQKDLLKTVESLYLPYGGHLYALTPESALKALLSKQGLADRAVALKQALLSPYGDMVKKMVAYDPLMLLLDAFKSYVNSQPKAPDQSAYANLVMVTAMSGMDAPAQTGLQRAINETFANAVKSEGEKARSYRLEMTGVPIFAVATQQLLERDIAVISTLSTLTLALLFYWLFRSFRVFFWISCLLIATFTLTLLIVNAVFGSIHTMTLAIGSTLVGVCVDYPIHALVHAQALPMDKRAAAISKLLPSMALGAATTSIGYVVLGLSGYPGFQQVALYAASGIVISLVLTRYLLLSLMAGINTPCRRLIIPELWIRLCGRFRPVFFCLLLAFLGACAWQLTSLRWLQDLQQLTPELDYLKDIDRKIRERTTPIEPGRFLLVAGSDEEHALQAAEQIYPLLDRLKTAGKLIDYYGLYPWLLSQKQQRQNAELLASAIDDTVLKNWRHALIEYGLSADRLALLSYKTDAPLSVEAVLQTPVGKMLANQFIHASTKTLILIWLGEHDPDALREMAASQPNTRYFSQRDLLNELAGAYQKRAQNLACAGFIGILALLAVRYKSLVKAFVTLLPAVAATVIILAGCSAAGEPISFLHMVGILLVISICDDFAIFFRENPGGDAVLTYQAVAASMLTSALGFGCLFSAQTALLKTLATVVSGGVLLGFLLCPILIKHADHPYDAH